MWKDKLPDGSKSYIEQLVHDQPVFVVLSRPRKSKWGDFTSPRRGSISKITVNADLDTFHFLIVFIHEWAHFLTWKKHKHKVSPHGKEWKSEYTKLLEPLIEMEILPNEIHGALIESMRRPSASSCRDLKLMRALHASGSESSNKLRIEHLSTGAKFQYQGRQFILVKKARTRYHCRETQSNRMFAFHALAEIESL